ncbi:hypothetical protein [Thiomicrorhabdus arctica]|uniref:hypothetical protein n=1 Tax=Thiomicrorhabdus arctica TaxID=131540 RepID=UPI00037F3BD4|nr:hypothetical protein [Thiomicrorhabdus arctica]
MSIKEDAHALVDQLPNDADWDDLVKLLYKKKRITLGMTALEVAQPELTDSDINSILGRIESSSSEPTDMRNTRTYQPGNASTLGMVAGVIAILFSFVFPPIAWIAAPVAFISGVIGLKNKEEKAWVPILLSLVSAIPMMTILLIGDAGLAG